MVYNNWLGIKLIKQGYNIGDETDTYVQFSVAQEVKILIVLIKHPRSREYKEEFYKPVSYVRVWFSLGLHSTYKDKTNTKKERQWDNNIENISYDTIQYLITKKRKQTCKYVMKEM